MNCREFVDFLMSYLDGELPKGEHDTFERHMRDCPPCVDYLDSYRDTIKMGKCVCEDREDAPVEAPERLVEAILAARGSSN